MVTSYSPAWLSNLNVLFLTFKNYMATPLPVPAFSLLASAARVHSISFETPKVFCSVTSFTGVRNWFWSPPGLLKWESSKHQWFSKLLFLDFWSLTSSMASSTPTRSSESTLTVAENASSPSLRTLRSTAESRRVWKQMRWNDPDRPRRSADTKYSVRSK